MEFDVIPDLRCIKLLVIEVGSKFYLRKRARKGEKEKE